MAHLVIHYSLTGNTKYIASVIRDALGADELILPLKGACPDFSCYDVVFLGAPVWAFGVPKPMSSFLKCNCIQGKSIALFCSFSLFKGRFFSGIRKMLLGNTIVGESEFQDPVRFNREKHALVAREWAQTVVSSCK